MVELKLPLSNVQIELMKLYSTNLSDNEIMELKDVLANFFGNKAIEKANQIWDERGLNNEDMDKWLNQKS
ncbi:MAG: hypothetical protein H7178_04800 [Chitinophagaceae bacterium]|nr:hypothetical protein [Chitinophagaceae bacterium]